MDTGVLPQDEKAGKTLSWTLHYCIVELDTNTARVHRVDRPQYDTIQVALGHLRRCADEILDVCWPPQKERKQRPAKGTTPVTAQVLTEPGVTTTTSPHLYTSLGKDSQPKTSGLDD